MCGCHGKEDEEFWFRDVRVRFLGGFEIKLLARYYARSQARVEKGKGVYFGLILLEIYDHCSPALASEVAKLAAAMNSLEDARKQLAEMGVQLSGKQIAAIAYQFSQRARLRQKAGCMGIPALIWLALRDSIPKAALEWAKQLKRPGRWARSLPPASTIKSNTYGC